ncbi:MAG: helix-turn-helix domain-containing protein [Haloarculaceae archaeon]
MNALSRLDVRRRAETPTPDLQQVLDVLDSSRHRALLETLGEGAFTAGELAERLDIPRSTLYRYLRRLVELGLVEESLRLSPTGHHRSEYTRGVTDVVVSLTGEDGFSITLV